MEAATTTTDVRAINEKIERESAFIDLLVAEMNKTIVGQKHMIDRLLIGLLGQGHILLEGVPGLAKTLAINTLSKAVHGSFSRIQFTPDLLPADVVGTMIYNVKENDFSIKKGPIFANFILADEINRAPAKVQSALLEAMQEKQVTIGDQTHILQKPFLVMATQNPVEQEGTYPLPEAQMDRFMLKTVIDYPKLEEERLIVRQNLSGSNPVINPVVSLDQILRAKATIKAANDKRRRAKNNGCNFVSSEGLFLKPSMLLIFKATFCFSLFLYHTNATTGNNKNSQKKNGCKKVMLFICLYA